MVLCNSLRRQKIGPQKTREPLSLPEWIGETTPNFVLPLKLSSQKVYSPGTQEVRTEPTTALLPCSTFRSSRRRWGHRPSREFGGKVRNEGKNSRACSCSEKVFRSKCTKYCLTEINAQPKAGWVETSELSGYTVMSSIHQWSTAWA